MADVSGNNANYYTSPYAYPIDNGKYTTLVGEFQNSHSPYGTFDQGGNVWEWNEAVEDGSFRRLRGGSFSSSDVVYNLHASYRSYLQFPMSGYHYMGFRVSQVPEPATLFVMMALGLPALLKRRRRVRS